MRTTIKMKFLVLHINIKCYWSTNIIFPGLSKRKTLSELGLMNFRVIYLKVPYISVFL